MISEVFAQGESPLHNIDPRLRVVIALLYSSIIALSSGYAVLMSGLVISALLVMQSHMNLMKVLNRLTVLGGFLALIWVLLPVTYPGKALFSLGPIHLSQPGLHLCLQISLKSIAILLALMALLATMPVATLGHTLERFGIPDKIVYLLLITYRYIFVIDQEYRRLIRAMRIRGFKPKTNLHSYRTFAYLIGMLFVKASARADRVSKAMKCRGFNGRFHSLSQNNPDPRNLPFAAVMLSIILILAMVEIWT